MRTHGKTPHPVEKTDNSSGFDTSFSRHDMCVVVGIASAGRPEVLNETVAYLQKMANQADGIIICVPDMKHAGKLASNNGVELLTGQRGLTIQRNHILAAAAGKADILVFLDDDFIPSPDFFTQINKAFSENPDIAIATGCVLADGILSDGLDMHQALGIITASRKSDHSIIKTYNAYGCNMAVRMNIVVSQGLQFDEKLPLYGWLEDVDFSRLMARFGQSVRIMAAQGVHLGVRSARQPGNRLGYSQIANPYYLTRKGTMSARRAAIQAGRNIVANLAGVLRRDRKTDRQGRLRGNLLALSDILKGISSPQRILEIAPQLAHPVAGHAKGKQEVKRP